MRPGRSVAAIAAVGLLLAAAPAPAAPTVTTTVLAAGDIADCSSNGDERTADLLDTYPADTTILTMGDNAYDRGTLTEFQRCFDPTWGSSRSDRIKPSPGNHEYLTPGAAGYFDYFGWRAGPDDRGWYSFDRPGWHIVSLNSERFTTTGSAQLAWLVRNLAATDQPCILAYWHTPRFSRGAKSDDLSVQPFWTALAAVGADVVLNAHDHNYQRYKPMTPAGAYDANGIRQFIVGTGGRGTYALRADTRRDAGTDSTFGVLELTLTSGAYSWRFRPVAGSSYTDTGSDTCG